ncbi:MAG: hypothetical protein HY331_10275 [Chloroflexi bacterium]|nr:hypothetical protein [Chloroflexota bacterium]
MSKPSALGHQTIGRSPAVQASPIPLTFRVFSAYTAYWAIALAVDAQRQGIGWQLAIGVSTWAFLGVTLVRATATERTQTITMVGVATICECIGSLLWGAYDYQYGNIPSYVPPGHGLFYLTARRLAAHPWLVHRAGTVVTAVFVASGLWSLRGVLPGWQPDLLGLLTWLVLARFLRWGRNPLFYAVSFVATMGLEYFGTSVGTWSWNPIVPYTGISAGNPPSAIGAAYCVMDSIATRLATVAGRLAQRLRRPGA